jgi:hypothetical protein
MLTHFVLECAWQQRTYLVWHTISPAVCLAPAAAAAACYAQARLAAAEQAASNARAAATEATTRASRAAERLTHTESQLEDAQVCGRCWQQQQQQLQTTRM